MPVSKGWYRSKVSAHDALFLRLLPTFAIASYVNEYNFQGDFYRILANCKTGDVKFICEQWLPADDEGGAKRADFVVWSDAQEALTVVELKCCTENCSRDNGCIKTKSNLRSFAEHVAAEDLPIRVRRARKKIGGGFTTKHGVFIMAFHDDTFKVHIASYK